MPAEQPSSEILPANIFIQLRELKFKSDLAAAHAALAKSEYERGSALAFLRLGLSPEDTIDLERGLIRRAALPVPVESSEAPPAT